MLCSFPDDRILTGILAVSAASLHQHGLAIITLDAAISGTALIIHITDTLTLATA